MRRLHVRDVHRRSLRRATRAAGAPSAGATLGTTRGGGAGSLRRRRGPGPLVVLPGCQPGEPRVSEYARAVHAYA